MDMYRELFIILFTLIKVPRHDAAASRLYCGDSVLLVKCWDTTSCGIVAKIFNFSAIKPLSIIPQGSGGLNAFLCKVKPGLDVLLV